MAEGRKPLFHEQLDDAAGMADRLRDLKLAGVRVEAIPDPDPRNTPHLVAWNERAARTVLDSDRAFYRPAGEDDAAAIRRAVLAQTIGELMGYGERTMNLAAPLVLILASDETVLAGFRAPAEAALLFALARAADYAALSPGATRIAIRPGTGGVQ